MEPSLLILLIRTSTLFPHDSNGHALGAIKILVNYSPVFFSVAQVKDSHRHSCNHVNFSKSANFTLIQNDP